MAVFSKKGQKSDFLQFFFQNSVHKQKITRSSHNFLIVSTQFAPTIITPNVILTTVWGTILEQIVIKPDTAKTNGTSNPSPTHVTERVPTSRNSTATIAFGTDF